METGAGSKTERMWTPDSSHLNCQEESLGCLMTWALWADEEEKEEDVMYLIDDFEKHDDNGQSNPLLMPITEEEECKEFFNEFLEESKDDGPKFEIFTKMMTGHDIEKDESEKISEKEEELALLLLEKLLGEDKNGAGQITAWSIMIMICFAVLEFLQ